MAIVPILASDAISVSCPFSSN